VRAPDVIGAIGAMLAVLCAGSAPARAGDESGAIAILPFTSAAARLEIYGVPVSRALAAELRGAAGAQVQIVSDLESMPRRISWVIDGRILERRGGRVVLEARLRDPDQGSAAGVVATRARPLRQIDRLARDLARQLVPVLEGARSARKQEAERRVAIRKAEPGPAPEASPAPEAKAPRSTRRLLIGRTGGETVGGLAADPTVTTVAADLVSRLGRRPVVVELVGVASPDAVRAALAGAGASHAVLSHVHSLQFSWRGVLTARGRVRVVLVDAGGRALYDSIIETDTLVGSRGDRHEALLGFVARQAMQIAAPRLRKLLPP
jgi:hypothetical protein